MRRGIVPVGADSLSYEIREIVIVANELKKMGLDLIYENIGDPVAKGEKIENWIKEEIKKLVEIDQSWAYCDTQGVLKTREFIAEQTNAEGGIQITPNDVYFFNGIGDAIAKIFGFLKREARVIGPSPAYSTHSSAEAAHSGYEHLTYLLNPDKDWEPDINEIYNKAKYNDSIAGILVINPGNPTGAVISRNILKRICEIAEELDLFVICDEIYSEIVYPDAERVKLSTVIGNACGISLRGISKEIPWPGSRCGWIEVYNGKKNKEFQKYIETILKAKRLEVCSTTLPQLSIPLILGNPLYKEHLRKRAEKFAKRAEEAKEIFDKALDKGVRLIKPKGAFYMTVLFDEKFLHPNQYIKIENKDIRQRIEELCSQKIEYDKRFVYYLMGSTGIVTVPLTSFYSKLKGIRITLLEEDDEKRKYIYETIRDKMVEYINS
ncbi:MAG TPA: pyridoxal phosphate-dependent aminotransferase [Spirochaetota bacterium]|nr:pyridoxal phosphate-dependent aminotransferase [Spirochaetota bacterium]HOL56033.1 pyridoxal phosphate-dependent aminotransferase [Spirochaetota bacterium]HPP03475.1 pyridoxal phosphate-dependent aminotransferase [Spirochaetota bacterium]